MEGKYHCNSCGLNYDVEVNLSVMNPEKLVGVGIGDEGEDAEGEMPEGEGEDINDTLNTEPAAATPAPPAANPMPAEMPGMGAHSNNWLRTAALRFVLQANPLTFVSKGKKRTVGVPGPIGTICPQCGSYKVAFKESEGTCVSCGCKSNVKAKSHNDKLDVVMTWQPNLTLANQEKVYPNGVKGGKGITAECEDCEEVRAALHQILSSRNKLVKIASATEDENPMLACMSDQIATGFADEDAMEICASIKQAIIKKHALLEDNDGEDDEEEKEHEDNESDEHEDNESDEEEAIEEVTEDLPEEVDFTEFESDEDEDDTEFESEESEEAGEGTEDLDDVQEVTEVVVKFKDSAGNDGEFSLSVGDVESGEEENVSNIPDDIEEVIIQEETDDEPEMEEGIEETDGDKILQEFFTDGTQMDAAEEEMAAESTMLTPEQARIEAKKTSELLRGDTVMSSNRSGGANLDMYKLALAMGMPLDTEADVPRRKEDGIVEDGSVEVHTTSHKNEAKKMKGTAAGSVIAKEDVVKGADRGVEVIKPKSASMKNALKQAVGQMIPSLEMEDEPMEEDLNAADPIMEDDGYEEDPIESVEDLDDPMASEMATGEAFLGGMDETDKANLEQALTQAGFAVDQIPAILEELESHLENSGGEPIEQELIAGNKKIKIKIAKKVKAQKAPAQLEPTDAVQKDSGEEKLNVPRNKAKAKPEIDVKRKDVNNPTEVRNKGYAVGPEATNLHSDVVPRDGSGDGIGGKKPKFDQESGPKQTSGKPDTYVQEFQKDNQIAPTPAGNEDNHAVAAAKAIKKITSSKNLDEKKIKIAIKNKVAYVKDIKSGKVFKMAFDFEDEENMMPEEKTGAIILKAEETNFGIEETGVNPDGTEIGNSVSTKDFLEVANLFYESEVEKKDAIERIKLEITKLVEPGARFRILDVDDITGKEKMIMKGRRKQKALEGQESLVASKEDAIKKIAASKGLDATKLEASDVAKEDGFFFVTDLESGKVFRVNAS